MSKYLKQINDTIVEMSEKEINERKAKEKEWNDNLFNNAIKDLREERNKLLAETDYLSLSDQSLTDEMKKYRQDLRDITKGLSTVEQVKAVEFPTKP
tara:strand:- start:51 stop:341 length:291 start_codon:yes stop_codon:yes gene_type:complete